ncbi:hypothetical protein PTE30175_04875 [Pandoraea terrae]|uniref:Uncharacterized protein n=1 Tax=Pandoraea terrae TaxID=1537710 RepID=A0A5E4Z1T1_9BURK|nr:hypothetical protein [Pandoraea terrae]VVE55066.1 hypothetical protein PTE30175_04875 [Pandoraea terrae]
MEIVWKFENSDVERVRQFVSAHRAHPFVRGRVEKNVRGAREGVKKNDFWRAYVGCLVTTQQSSGDDSYVSKFLKSRSELLRFSAWSGEGFQLSEIEAELRGAGLRRNKTIAKQMLETVHLLQEGEWGNATAQLSSLLGADVSRKEERCVAEYFAKKYAGLGPKQSRNLLQTLGLTKYEIPLDSRVSKALQKLGFPIKLTAQSLACKHFYVFTLDAVQELCVRADVYPCEFDACAFVSEEKRT